MLVLKKEIEDVTQRKNDLAVKLSDLDSLKYVIDELEKKIKLLTTDYDQQSKTMDDKKIAFKTYVV